MTGKTNAQKAANLQAEVRNMQTVFTSKSFLATVEVMGEAADETSFSFYLTFDNKDPEFITMINDYAARKSAEIVTLMDADRNNTSVAL